MSALRLRQSSHYLAHLKEPPEPQAAPAMSAQSHTRLPPPLALALAQQASLEPGATVSPSPPVRAGGVGGEGVAKGQDDGGEAHMWQDGGPGVVVNVAHPPVDEPEDEAAEEDEQGDNDKQAGKKGATGTSFVGTRMLQMKKDAEAAAKKALEGQKVSLLLLLRSRQLSVC
jgi:hypothetical protein